MVQNNFADLEFICENRKLFNTSTSRFLQVESSWELHSILQKLFDNCDWQSQVLRLSKQLLDILTVGFVEGLIDVVVGLLPLLSQSFEVIQSSDNQLGLWKVNLLEKLSRV